MKERNVKEQAEQGRKLIEGTRYELSSGELEQMAAIFTGAESQADGLWNVILTAFNMGAAVGARKADADRRAMA